MSIPAKGIPAKDIPKGRSVETAVEKPKKAKKPKAEAAAEETKE
jgi:hypothetical protein